MAAATATATASVIRPLSRGGSCLRLQLSHNHTPTARAFLNVAASFSTSRRSLHTPSSSSTTSHPVVLDFLAPNVPSLQLLQQTTTPIRQRQGQGHVSSRRISRRGGWSNHVSPRVLVLSDIHIASRSTHSTRSFTTSTPSRNLATTDVVLNPRKDDDGNDMAVEITPRASRRLGEIMAKDSNPHLALRITVESGGCHGFQYLMSLTTLPPLEGEVAEDTAETKTADLDPAEDTVFQATDGSKAKVVMDLPSLELLKGSKIDYTMELIGSQFKIVDNPLATSSCGCGTSFDVKI